MAGTRKFIDTETVIVNLLKEEMKTYLPIRRLEKLVNYIYQQLVDNGFLQEYNVLFNVNFDSIERTVLYNNTVFELIGETIYLKKPIEEIQTDNNAIDDRLKEIIKKFCDVA